MTTEITLKEQLSKILNQDWLDKLYPWFDSSLYRTVRDKLIQEKKSYTIYPETANVFRALNLCSYDELKVVMAAQDPYHQINTADGLAFSCGKTNRPQPSLQHIYKEIINTTGSLNVAKNNFDLSYLAKQGILLINRSLTVRQGQPNSHNGLWDNFMSFLFEVIGHKDTPIVYILLGNEAKTFIQYARINDPVITAKHPASAAYTGGTWDCNDCFSQCNKSLEANGLTKIDW